MKIVWNIVLTFVCSTLGGIVMMALAFGCMYLYPMPPGLALDDKEGFAKYVSTLPVSAFVLVLVSHFIGPFIGATLATRFAAYRSIIPAVVIGGLYLLGGILNLRDIKPPLWFAIADLPLYPLAAWLGILLGKQKEPTAKP